jgi:hypothetical protein
LNDFRFESVATESRRVDDVPIEVRRKVRTARQRKAVDARPEETQFGPRNFVAAGQKVGESFLRLDTTPIIWKSGLHLSEKSKNRHQNSC